MILKVAKARIEASAYMVDRAQAKVVRANEQLEDSKEGYADTLCKLDNESHMLQKRVDDLNALIAEARKAVS